jgi:hypothetical protein
VTGAARPTPVLGAHQHVPGTRGWGTVRPRTVFNGGDPSGLVSDIHWLDWGGPRVRGWGETSIFRPSGGYYPRLVKAELRPFSLGRCSRLGPLAYRRLEVRVPVRPGGPLGPWTLWAGNGNICHLA